MTKRIFCLSTPIPKALVQQTGTRVLGYVVNKQRRGREDAAYAYYYSNEELASDNSNQSVHNGRGVIPASGGIAPRPTPGTR